MTKRTIEMTVHVSPDSHRQFKAAVAKMGNTTMSQKIEALMNKFVREDGQECRG